MTKTLTVLILIATSGLLTAPLVYGASSGSMGGGYTQTPPGSNNTTEIGNTTGRTPRQMAVSSYNAGLNHKKHAQEYEDKAATAKNDKDRDKQLAKAQSAYKDAIEDYKKAIGYDNTAYQAMNELGFAMRKTGDYQTALVAYNTALTVKPGFAPAIEYRGETYLALSRFKDVQSSYMELVRVDQDQAAALMIAMVAWQELHAADATAEGKEFATWVQERKAVAVNTLSLSSNNVHAWN